MTGTVAFSASSDDGSGGVCRIALRWRSMVIVGRLFDCCRRTDVSPLQDVPILRDPLQQSKREKAKAIVSPWVLLNTSPIRSPGGVSHGFS